MQSSEDGVGWMMYMAHMQELYHRGLPILGLISVEVLELIPEIVRGNYI